MAIETISRTNREERIARVELLADQATYLADAGFNRVLAQYVESPDSYLAIASLLNEQTEPLTWTDPTQDPDQTDPPPTQAVLGTYRLTVWGAAGDAEYTLHVRSVGVVGPSGNPLAVRVVEGTLQEKCRQIGKDIHCNVVTSYGG